MSLALFERARRHAHRTAIVAPEGELSYGALSAGADSVATCLLAGRPDLDGERVCLLAPSGWSYVAALWGIWRAGGVAVPLAVSFPPAELEHVLDDVRPVAVVAHSELAPRLAGAADARTIRLLDAGAASHPSFATHASRGHPVPGRVGGAYPDLALERPGMILYTSGTTGRPKGAVLSHGNVQAQLESLTQAWGWTATDRVLLHLPLHHVHGIVNVLTSALWNGAVCEMLPSFRAEEVWERLASGASTLYMSVPTAYARLIEAWDAASAHQRAAWSGGARACRLMVSGSAALPIPTLERWEEITGHRLLERYGMTEIGMALSNPLVGERRAGHVGSPLPGVEVRLVDEAETPVPPGTPGQVQVRGPTVFRSYWERPAETSAAFTPDGWFRTGDIAILEGGAYRILGRANVDILKSGGEKISALEIEDVLRMHEAVADCAVVGVADAEWGERVCAAVVRRPASEVSEGDLRTFAKSRLAPYKVPKQILLVADLPRNPMGKVTKPAVRELFENEDR